MKILYVTQYFPPEMGAGARRAYEMAAAWKAEGHAVRVICPHPNYPEGRVQPRYAGKGVIREQVEGIDVIRVPIYTNEKKTFVSRLANYASFALRSAWAVLKEEPHNLVYVTSPPLPAGLAGLVARLRGARFVFEVRDLWPESARALGELNSKPAYWAAEKFEELCYAAAERIVVVTRGIHDRLVSRGLAAERIILAPNGANLNQFQAATGRYGSEDLPQPGISSEPKLEIFYGGLLGLAQGIPALIETLKLLKNDACFRLTIAGSGPYAEALRELKDKEGINGLTLLGNLPSHEMPAHIARADVCLVPLGKDALFRGALPSKLFEAWACGRPVLLSATGEAARLVVHNAAGIVVSPEDPGSLAEAVRWLARNRPALAEMGRRGQAAVAAYDRGAIARQLVKTLEAA